MSPQASTSKLPRRMGVIAVSLIVIALVSVSLMLPAPIRADHESTTSVVLEPVDAAGAEGASGAGLVEFHGGPEPESRWTLTFEFTGLEPNTGYVLMVQGRFGNDGSPEASAFTELCRFTSDEQGEGACWYYFVGLRRLSVMELRQGDADGPAVLRATKGDGPGSMTRSPNAFSIALTATPAPATPLP